MREIVICCGEEQCGYHIDPNNPSDIAWGVISALENPERRKLLGKNGRKRVIAEFTWSKIAKKTIAALRNNSKTLINAWCPIDR